METQNKKDYKKTQHKELKTVMILLKILAWGILVVGIIFSIFFAPANLFSMVIFILFIIVVFAILYALSAIIKVSVDLSKELQTLMNKNK